jgi:predicted nucleic acid-binding protein
MIGDRAGMDAFDTDVLIYAATNHRLGARVRALVAAGTDHVGSVLLLPELLSKPIRTGAVLEVQAAYDLLSRLTLLPCDTATAELATSLGSSYGLRTADAVHLATAVQVGADRFITNNRRDFPQTIEEVEIVYPDEL